MLQQLLRRRDKEMRQDDATRNAVQYVSASKQAKKATLGLSGFLLGISAGGFCTSRRRF